MVRTKFRNIVSEDEGIVTCEQVIFGRKEVIAEDVEKIDGTVDIIDIEHLPTSINFHINMADLYWIKSA